MERMPFIRHPWYPQSAYLFRRARLHAPTPDPMGAFGEDYTYGSFSSKSPYAFQPKHTGLDGYYSRGYGEGYLDSLSASVGDPCGIEAAKTWLVEELFKLPPFSSIPGKVEVAGQLISNVSGEAKKQVRAALDAAVSAAFPPLIAAAKQSAGAASGYFASNMATPLAAALKTAMSGVGAGSFAPSGATLANMFTPLAYKLVTWLETCAGKAPVAAPSTGVAPRTDVSMLDYPSNDISASMAAIRAKEAQMFTRPGEQATFTEAFGPYATAPAGTLPTTATGGGGGSVAVLAGAALLALLLLR